MSRRLPSRRNLELESYVAGVDVAMLTAAFASDGGGPYGITVSPDGDIYFAALSGSYVGRGDPDSGEITRLDPPTPDQGARRV